MSSIIKSSFVIEKKENIVKTSFNVDEACEKLLSQANDESYKIIENAKDEAKKIIDAAKEQGDKILEEIYEKTASISREAKEQGFQEGFNEGYSEGKRASDELIDEANTIKKEYLKERERILADIEGDVISLVMNICEKVLYKSLDEDRESIINVILKGLDSLNARDSIVIRVSKEDYDVVELSKERILSMASLIDEISIKVDNSLSKGDCIIESTRGSVDASVSSQIQQLKDIVTNLINSE